MNSSLMTVKTSLSDLRFSEVTEKLVALWKGLPRENGQLIPKRTALTDRDLDDIRDEIFLSEWYSEDVLTIVESGKSLQRWLGMDLQGHNILALFTEPTAEAEKRHYNLLRDTPCAGVTTRTGSDVAGTPFIYRTLQLPLLDVFGQVRYFIGSGTMLDEKQRDHLFASTYFTSVQSVERRYFDIGAGTPEPEA